MGKKTFYQIIINTVKILEYIRETHFSFCIVKRPAAVVQYLQRRWSCPSPQPECVIRHNKQILKTCCSFVIHQTWMTGVCEHDIGILFDEGCWPKVITKRTSMLDQTVNTTLVYGRPSSQCCGAEPPAIPFCCSLVRITRQPLDGTAASTTPGARLLLSPPPWAVVLDIVHGKT